MLKIHLDAQVLFDALPDAAIILDCGGKIRHINPSAHMLFQYEEDEIKGQPIEVLIPARFRIRHIADRELLLRNEEHLGAWGPNRKLIALRKDGSEFHVLVKVSKMTISQVELVLCLIRDFSAMHGVEQKAHELWSQFQCLAWMLEIHLLPEILREAAAELGLSSAEKISRSILLKDLIERTRELAQPFIERAAADLIVEELSESIQVHFRPCLLQLALLSLVKLCAEAVSPLGERWVKAGFEVQGSKLLITLTDSAYSMSEYRVGASDLEFIVSSTILQRYGGQLLTSGDALCRFCVSVPIQSFAQHHLSLLPE